MKDGDYAGLIALQSHYGFAGVKMEGTQKSVVVVNAENNSAVETATVPLTQNRIWLRIDCDFKDRADTAAFSYSLDGKNWNVIGKPHHLRYDLVHFMGCRFGLFNFATKTPGGHVDFDFFHIGGHISPPK